MADGVLLDTSFLITFADPSKPHHAVAVRYFGHFVDQGIPMFISTIVASEFQLGQDVEDLPLDVMIVLPFNWADAMAAAELDFRRGQGTPGTSRVALKDDFKILGQAKSNDIAFVITEDRRTLYKYCEDLKQQHQLSAQAIKLEDGFFDLSGQRLIV